jgi:hypothetical protein
MKTGKQSGVVRTQEFCLPYLTLLGEYLYFLLYCTSTSCTIQLHTFERTHTFAQNVASAGTYCYFKNTITVYVLILNYVLQVSLQLYKFARPQCKEKGEIPMHYLKSHVGVEL